MLARREPACERRLCLGSRDAGAGFQPCCGDERRDMVGAARIELQRKPHVWRHVEDAGMNERSRAKCANCQTKIVHHAVRAGSILIIARVCRLIRDRTLKITFREYFRSSSLSAANRSSPSISDAVASSHGPFTSPRTLQTATRTCGLFRMRLTFHESALVYKY